MALPPNYERVTEEGEFQEVRWNPTTNTLTSGDVSVTSTTPFDQESFTKKYFFKFDLPEANADGDQHECCMARFDDLFFLRNTETNTYTVYNRVTQEHIVLGDTNTHLRHFATLVRYLAKL
jgi:hypothetical protein